MRMDQLEVGEFYHFKYYIGEDSAKVEVLEIGVDLPFHNHRGVKVRFNGGHEKCIPARELTEPWHKVERRRAERAELERQRQERIDYALSKLPEIKEELERLDILNCLGPVFSYSTSIHLSFKGKDIDRLLEILRSAWRPEDGNGSS